MSAAPAAAARRVDPAVAFEARCQARALLYAIGELDLHDAVDVLQDDAVRDSLVADLGQDEVQRIMAYAFQLARNV